MDLRTLVDQMVQNQDITPVLNNPMAQFGNPQRPLLGATILPEENRPFNVYRERAVKWRTLLANDGTRYSPVQKKRGMMVGSMLVELAETDIGSELTGEDYDALLDLLRAANGNLAAQDPPTMQAMLQILGFVDNTVVRPLVEKNELQRWQVLVDAQLVRSGDDGFAETIAYPSPSGNRVAAAHAWSDNTYDPMTDIYAMLDFLAAKGFTVARIICGRPVLTKLWNNAKIQARRNRITIVGGSIVGVPLRVTAAELNATLESEGIPPIEEYNTQYQTETGTGYFLKRDVMVFICSTDREVSLVNPDTNPLVLQNTLGYYGIGRAQGANQPGRQFNIAVQTDKPRGIACSGWQTGAPVVLLPDAVAVINSIT